MHPRAPVVRLVFFLFILFPALCTFGVLGFTSVGCVRNTEVFSIRWLSAILSGRAASKAEHFSSKTLANKTVDEEVDTGIENAGKMGDVNETVYKLGWLEVASDVVTGDDFINMEKFKYVNDDSGAVEDKKSGDNTEKDVENVRFFLHFFF